MLKNPAVLLIPALLAVLQPSAALTQAPQSPYADGVLTLDFEYIDDLLALDGIADLSIVEVTTAGRATVSSAHLVRLRRWVEAGGTLWFHRRGRHSSLFDEILPSDIQFISRIVSKESRALFSDHGELFVRGLIPHLAIADHPLTTNVEHLFVKPDREPVAFMPEHPDVTPLVYFVSSPDGLQFDSSDDRRQFSGQRAVLFGVVEHGRGLIIIDLTRIGRRGWGGPSGDEYDGPTFYRNIQDFGRR